MKIEIKAISSLAYHILQSHAVGHVHSVYRKTINLQFGEQLVSLQTASSPVSPLSLITELSQDAMEQLPIVCEQPVEAFTSNIDVRTATEEITFDFSDAAIFDSRLFAISNSCAALLKPALESSASNGFLPVFFPQVQEKNPSFGDQFLVNLAAKNRISACTLAFHEADYEKATSELIHLIGLGIGLTPSGDDFLCGILAGLVLTDNQDHPFTIKLKEQLKKNLKNTNDISRAFLNCALKSHFSEAVKKIPTATSPAELLAPFEAIGHSSGIDTLCGIYYIHTLFD